MSTMARLSCLLLRGTPCDFCILETAVEKIFSPEDWSGEEPLSTEHFGISSQDPEAHPRVLLLREGARSLALLVQSTIEPHSFETAALLPLPSHGQKGRVFSHVLLRDGAPRALLLSPALLGELRRSL